MNAVCAVLCEQHVFDYPSSSLLMTHEPSSRLLAESSSDWTMRAAYQPSSHVVYVETPRIHDPLEFWHVTRVKIWVNICPPSFLIVRPMGKLLRAVPSSVLSIPMFSAL